MFFDLDGTLLASDHETVTPRTRQALLAAHVAGIRLAVATGRSYAIMPAAISGLPIDFYLTSNGADVLCAGTGRHYVNMYISQEDASFAWELLRGADTFVEWNVDNLIAVDRATDSRIDSIHMPGFHREYFTRTDRPVFDTVDVFLSSGAQNLEKINLLQCGRDERDVIFTELSVSGRFSLSNTIGTNIEINSRECTKGAAIRKLCDMLGIDRKESAAFGDGGNDIEMLGAAGMGVAMGNAPDSVKAAADVVTGTNDTDGIAQFIESLPELS